MIYFLLLLYNKMYYFRDVDYFILWNEPFYNNFNRNDIDTILKYKSLKQELIKNINYQWRFSINNKRDITRIIKEINLIITKYDFCINDNEYS
jgi:hypothetical protein